MGEDRASLAVPREGSVDTSRQLQLAGLMIEDAALYHKPTSLDAGRAVTALNSSCTVLH